MLRGVEKHMANLIDPRCVPSYLMQDASVAKQCGSISGGFVGLLVGGGAAVFFATAFPKWPTAVRVASAIAAFVVSVAACLLIGRLVMLRSWQTSQHERTAFKASGMADSEAMQAVQNLRNSQRAANATIMAGTAVASAIADR